MANDLGVTWSDLKARLDLDLTALPATSDSGLSQALLNSFCDQAAAEVIAALSRAGLTPTVAGLNATALLQAQRLVVDGGIKLTYERLGTTGPKYTDARRRWEDGLRRYENSPQALDGAPVGHMSNETVGINDCDSDLNSFQGRHFRF